MIGVMEDTRVKEFKDMLGDKEWMTVSKKVRFDAAHFLPNYIGKCQNLHGHSWSIEIAVEGPVDEHSGMVVDFTILSTFLKGICNTFDHTLLNGKIPNPTAENIVKYIKEQSTINGIGGKGLRWIKVWESEDSMAMWEAI